MSIKRWMTVIYLLSLTLSAQAATVYKKVDENGNLIFSDTPMEDSEKLDVQPVPTMKLPKARPNALQPKEKPTQFAYKSIIITEPQADQHFINNQGRVSVTVQVEPKLHPKHQLQLLFNGVKRAGPSATTTFEFSNLDRGSYSATAQVVDDKGNVITSSPTISFHIQRAFKRN